MVQVTVLVTVVECRKATSTTTIVKVATKLLVSLEQILPKSTRTAHTFRSAVFEPGHLSSTRIRSKLFYWLAL